MQNDIKNNNIAKTSQTAHLPNNALLEELNVVRIEGRYFCFDKNMLKKRPDLLRYRDGARGLVIESSRYGHPGVLAYKVLQAAFRKVTLEGRPFPDTISFTYRELARMMGRDIIGGSDTKDMFRAIRQLEDTKIGLVNQEGLKDDNITAPPIDDGRGVVEAPKRDETDYDQTFTKVEIESSYPGGTAAWQRYLIKTLTYPQEAQDNEVQGTVVVQFIVDKNGSVSDVEAVSGPNELRSEAVRVVKKSGKWTPAVQNGRQVKSYKKQPIQFRLETQ